VLFAQVVFRYVIQQPLSWSEEAGRFALVWLAMLSAVLAARKGLHFVFRLGTYWLPAPVRFSIRLAINLVIVIFLCLFLVESATFLEILSNQTAQATNVNMRVPFSGVVVGLIGLIAVYLLELFDGLMSLRTGKSFSLLEGQETKAFDLLTADEPTTEVASGGDVSKR
jgi:TRAP-type C4-dicarboxylate transport system permease small subunit